MGTNFKINKNAINNIKRALEEGLEDSTDTLKNKIKQNAPKDTGKLKKSIEKEKIDSLNIKVGTDTEYAPHVEFGTFKQSANPFFRSAVRSSANKMMEDFSKKLK